MLLEPQAELNSLLDGVRKFIDAEVVTRHVEHADLFRDPRRMYDSTGRFTDEVLELRRQIRVASADAGYYTMFVPEVLGGAGLDPVSEYWVWESIYRWCGPNHWLGHLMIAHWVRGPSVTLEYADVSVRNTMLPSLLSGERTMCFAMSEPDAGSDPWMMSTRATKTDGGWRITGTKQWITNGPYADYITLFAVTDPERAKAREGGISAFLVRGDAEGVSVQSVLTLFGEIGGDESILNFDEVFVADENVVGDLGAGLYVAMRNVSKGRLWQSAKAVGLARWALEQAFGYVQQRSAFGNTLSAYQGITFPLAESAMEVYGAHLMGLEAAHWVADGRRAGKEVAIAKAFGSEASLRAIERVMQVHGGMGFSNELGMIHAWQEVRRMLIGDGSSEIMRRTIATAILAGDSRL